MSRRNVRGTTSSYELSFNPSALSPEMIKLMEERAQQLARALMIPPGVLALPRPAYRDLPNDGVKEAVIGWRLWRVDGWRLKSVSVARDWLPGVPMTGDPANGAAGVYAFKDPSEAARNFISTSRGVAIGAIVMWGKIAEHERGYRAENAKITTISAVTPDVDLVALRALYLDLTPPAGATPVVNPAGKLLGVTSLQPRLPEPRWEPYLGRAVREDPPPIQVMEPMPVTSWLSTEPVNPVVSLQNHYWRGRSLVLEPGQNPTWLPDWVPLP